MPILSRKNLERISRRVLFRYLTLSDRKMDRIDPVDFAEKICGLHFAFADMSVTGSVLGLTSYSDVDLTISVPRGNGSVQEFHLNGNIAYVDQNLANAGSVGRLNFTLVHEAAHQILGMLYPEEYNPHAQPFICRFAEERCPHPITDWTEWQTNVLAACLLMPRELIYRRTKWHIEDSTERFYKHETQMSSLIGGENDGYERFHEFIDYDNTPENQAIEEMVRQSLRNILDLLPPKDYELIYELYFKNRSEKEYAQRLGVSQQAIHMRKKRILKKIKNNLDEQGC